MSLFLVAKPANAVVVHSLPERLHVIKILEDGQDPNITGDYSSYLTQPEGVTGTAMHVTFSAKIEDFFGVISEEEALGDHLGISTYASIGNVSVGPQISGALLGFTVEECRDYRWVTFAGYTELEAGNTVILALRAPRQASSASFGSTELLTLYKLVFDPTLAETTDAFVSITKVEGVTPFEPHNVQRITYINAVGQKIRRLVALGKTQPERYFNNMKNKLLETLQERETVHGLQQLNAAGLWYTDDPDGLVGWTLLHRPQVADVEIPSEQARGYTVGFDNFDIGMSYDRKWQRIVCAGIGTDGTESAARGREQFA